MVLLCKSDKIDGLGDVLRVPPQQRIENSRHFMPCTACMSRNCMRKAQAACASACASKRGLTPPRRTLRGAAGLFALRVTRRGDWRIVFKVFWKFWDFWFLDVDFKFSESSLRSF